MSAAEEVEIPLTVLINSENNKVLLAEVDSEFTDMLLSFLTLPLGKILGLFQKHYGEESPKIGSLNTLHKSLASLDDVYFWTSDGKQMLLNPRSTLSDDCRKLKYNLDDSQPVKYFVCGNYCCANKILNNYWCRTVDVYNSNGRCKCGKLLKTEIFRKADTELPDEGVFTLRINSNFTISDDMQIGTSTSGFIFQNLHNFGITNVYETTQMTFDVGPNEIMDLLKVLLVSRMPLTDFVRNKTPMNHVAVKCKSDTPVHIEQKDTSSKKMVVKAVLQKSTNRFLFAHAEDDFVDFLFSLLTIPLGGVAHLLGGNTCLGSVDNLYRSVASLDSKHLKTNGTKSSLLEPQLPCKYLSESQILPISEQITNLYCCWDPYSGKGYLSASVPENVTPATVFDPKGKGCYLRKPGMFMVTDDLSVTPLSTMSTISHLRKLEVPLSDVEEVDIEIGVNEALRILKESLASAAVFTNALNPVLVKQPEGGCPCLI